MGHGDCRRPGGALLLARVSHSQAAPKADAAGPADSRHSHDHRSPLPPRAQLPQGSLPKEIGDLPHRHLLIDGHFRRRQRRHPLRAGPRQGQCLERTVAGRLPVAGNRVFGARPVACRSQATADLDRPGQGDLAVAGAGRRGPGRSAARHRGNLSFPTASTTRPRPQGDRQDDRRGGPRRRCRRACEATRPTATSRLRR